MKVHLKYPEITWGKAWSFLHLFAKWLWMPLELEQWSRLCQRLDSSPVIFHIIVRRTLSCTTQTCDKFGKKHENTFQKKGKNAEIWWKLPERETLFIIPLVAFQSQRVCWIRCELCATGHPYSSNPEVPYLLHDRLHARQVLPVYTSATKSVCWFIQNLYSSDWWFSGSMWTSLFIFNHFPGRITFTNCTIS